MLSLTLLVAKLQVKQIILIYTIPQKIYILAASCLRQERTINWMQRTFVAMLVRS